MDYIIKYWLEFAFGLIVAGMGFVYRKIDCKLQEQEALKMGMQALLRDRIIQAFNYHIEKGYCHIHDKDNINNLYNQYHVLGGNGIVDDMFRKICELPTKKTIKEER